MPKSWPRLMGVAAPRWAAMTLLALAQVTLLQIRRTVHQSASGATAPGENVQDFSMGISRLVARFAADRRPAGMALTAVAAVLWTASALALAPTAGPPAPQRPVVSQPAVPQQAAPPQAPAQPAPAPSAQAAPPVAPTPAAP